MGVMDVLFGGLGKSTNPADYKVPSPYGSQINGYIQGGMAGVDGRPTPQAGQTQIATGPQDQFRQMQMQQAQQLQRIASGQQQGAGELAVQRQVANAQAAQQAQARMARGGNAGMAMLDSARNTAGIGLSGAGQSQQAAMGDQMNAQNMLTGVTGQGRGQDIGLATSQGQLTQGTNLANLDAQLRQNGMNDQARLGYLQQLTGLNAQELQAQLAAMGATLGQQGIMGGLLSAGGQIGAAAAMSDERAKTDIRDADSDIDEMMDRLTAKAYRYKNEAKHGAGERPGVMVQDLAKSRAGRALIVDMPQDPGLKGFDIGKAVSAALASAARLNARLRKLEGKAA